MRLLDTNLKGLTLTCVAVGSLALMTGNTAVAADLGGDCCADLEERVAELEATMVRVGNRKVSVSLYGQINSGILWYDNGEESDAYVVDVDTSTARIGVTGSATVRSGWDVGYTLEVGTSVDSVSGVAENDQDDNTDVSTRYADIYISSEAYGTLSFGQGDPATDSVIDGVDLSGPASWISYNGHADWVFSFSVIGAGACDYAGGGTCWGFMSAFDTSRANRVRYDTPTWQGLSLSASWGEDDQWDAAARYARDWNDFSFSSAIGYYSVDDEQAPGSRFDVWGGSASLYHSTSGLYVVGSYAAYDETELGADVADADQWYVKLGHRSNATSLGETSIYGEYGETDVSTPFGAEISNFGSSGAAFVLANTMGDAVTSANGTMWGIGIGQNIDAVGGTMYLGFRHLEADIHEGPISLATEDMSAVLTGMVLPF